MPLEPHRNDPPPLDELGCAWLIVGGLCALMLLAGWVLLEILFRD